MSASQFEEFDRRMERISKRHSKLSHGYVTRVNNDGLIEAKPKRRGGRVLLRGLVILALVLILFKAALLAQLGDAAYDARIASLAEGTLAEQIGSYLMVKDAVTAWLAPYIGSLVR